MAQRQPSLLRHCKEHPQGPPYLAAVENPFPFLQTENLFSFLSLYKDHHLTKRACLPSSADFSEDGFLRLWPQSLQEISLSQRRQSLIIK